MKALPRFKAEWSELADEATGAKLTRWTSHPSMQHHCYFTNPTISPDSRRGFFVSYRTGYPNLFAIDLASGELTQITDRMDINPFSPSPARRTDAIYFSARSEVWRVDTVSGETRMLHAFSGAKMGNCSLSRDDALLAIGLRYADRCELALIETATGAAEILHRADEIGHIQFSPRNDNQLLYSGPVTQRLWMFDRVTGVAQPVYRQQVGEWVVHETWRCGARDEVIFPHWPYAIHAIRPDGSGLRTIAEINAWHACGSPDGNTIVCDTNHPDRGLLLIDVETGQWRALCHPGATQRGTQWQYDEPAKGAGIDTSIIRSDTPEKDPAPTPKDASTAYGPQWSHPHPSFSHDGKTVIFTSDRDGWSQVFSVTIASAESSG